jgi:putative membrane protein
MSTRTLAVCTAAAALLSWQGLAFAGQAKPAAKTPAAAKAGGSADKAFVREAASGGMLEVELGKMAASQAANEDVKRFGQRMVDDHSKANNDLSAVARQKNVALPDELEAKHKAVRDKLAKLSGAAFDQAYMKDMVSDHQKDVAAFGHEAKDGSDPDVKAFASRTLPVLEEHLKMARETAAKVGATTETTAKSTKSGTKKH